MYAFPLHSAVILVLVVAAGGGPAWQGSASAQAPQQSGSVTGEVHVARGPVRRAAERYAGPVPAAERPVQEPPVAGFRLLQWAAIDALAEIGYRHAGERLEHWDRTGDSRR